MVKSSKNVDTRIPQTYNGILLSARPGARMLTMVVMKLIAPRIDDAPARVRLRIARSTAGSGRKIVEDKGGKTVHPPPPTNIEQTRSNPDGTSSQKLRLLSRGNAISGAPIISGTIQLPMPPISAGIARKKTMISPWVVISMLKKWGFGMNWIPGSASSNRNQIDIAPPTRPKTSAKTRYIVPMSLWLVEKSHRRQPVGWPGACWAAPSIMAKFLAPVALRA